MIFNHPWKNSNTYAFLLSTSQRKYVLNISSWVLRRIITIDIRKGMYGIKEDGILVFKIIVNNIAPFGYISVRYTPGLWKHESRSTPFILCVDDFGIKYHE